ncbi:MAG: hypothetical protein RQ729_10730 [Wenzhouxiangellaceae bacterium]|nr:hypothetical protein [Wenzhouxiangellaceae bacterium]
MLYKTTFAVITTMLLAAPLAAGTSTRQIETDDVRLDVHFNAGIRHDGQGGPWLSWLADMVEAVRSVTGAYPLPEVVIRLDASHRARDAIAFGQVRRSSPPEIRFYVDPRASAADLAGDWRGYHEFAHLMIPFPGNNDIWFSEGFASYYQYLLQARAGAITPEQAWQELHKGFERGLSDRAGRGQTLRNLSPRMWAERAYRRVYWTGAAYFLRVDTRLRTESDGEYSLDRVIAEFQHCCRESERRWSAEQLIETLGALSLPSVWREEYQAMIDQPAEPRFESAYRRLGLNVDKGRIRFADRPDASALRLTLMQAAKTAVGAYAHDHGDRDRTQTEDRAQKEDRMEASEPEQR